MQNKITPIILIGMNRSGTKWLSNLLCGHPDIIGVQHERHFGILETNMFDKAQAKFGQLSRLDDYIGFIELWAQSDFFVITNADKKLFYELNPRPTSYLELFKILMDDYARRHGKKFWLQKTSPFNALEVAQYFSEAPLVIIKRNILDNIRSAIQLGLNSGYKMSVTKEIYRYVLQDKILQHIRQEPRAIYVEFEELKANPAEQTKQICEQIGIPYHETMLDVGFIKNTSFSHSSRNDYFVITKSQKFEIKTLSKALQRLPLSTLWAIHRRFRVKRASFVSGTFRGIKEKYNLS